MDSIQRILEQFNGWFSQPLFHVGDVEVGLSRITIALLIVALTWVLSSRFEGAVRRLATQGKVTRMTGSGAYALGRVIRYASIVVGVLIGLRILGVELTNLAILGGAIGVGIGIGLQNIFNNFLAGIVLLFEKTLKVGDFVELEFGLVGRVAEIDMRYTRITTNDLVDVMVPNSQFTDKRVTNWSYGEHTRRLHIPFGVAFTARKDEEASDRSGACCRSLSMGHSRGAGDAQHRDSLPTARPASAVGKTGGGLPAGRLRVTALDAQPGVRPVTRARPKWNAFGDRYPATRPSANAERRAAASRPRPSWRSTSGRNHIGLRHPA